MYLSFSIRNGCIYFFNLHNKMLLLKLDFLYDKKIIIWFLKITKIYKNIRLTCNLRNKKQKKFMYPELKEY